MKLEDLKSRMAKCKLEIKQAIDSDIPKKVARKMVSMTKQNFQEEGFYGKPWKEVQRRQPPQKGRRRYRGADTQRKILTGRTGDLGRSIRSEVGTATVTIYSDLPYSAAHNEGTNNAGRGHRTRIPKRQFLGEHPKVHQEVKKIIETEISKILKR